MATGGARLLFADLRRNLRRDDGVLRVDRMRGHHHVDGSGRGLRLVPSLFAHQPAPPVSAAEPPMLAYPGRGAATLWEPEPEPDAPPWRPCSARPAARCCGCWPSRCRRWSWPGASGVTPSAVSQHLRVLHATGLVTRARDGGRVLYRRSPPGEQLARHGTA
ncbi:ArsR/SmtB family transcription factor [Streptomyces swartbergensis]|uniref:ArsR/SmtB family transcription factor n=1 Tax=Streptomyces swartbergensis TaxID=487165 RepID=UPI0037F839F0